LVSFEETIAHFEHLFRLRPEVVAHDLHPDYLATRYALKRADEEGLEPVGVQHHHAHIASCMAEHALPADRPVIGVAFDGTGYGTDGTIWGGEFLVADYETFRRAYWLRPVPLPGGDSAIRHPWRMALAWLDAAGLPWEERLDCVQAASEIELSVVRNQIDTRTNAPLTTSMGRLFDAVASLARVRQSVNYEAQAAIELEALVDPDEHCAYPFELGDGPIDVRPALEDMWLDLESGISPSIISARFHNGVAQMVKTTCEAIRRWEGLENVALSGGVWQNMTLLHKSVSALETAGFTVYIHRQVPANDGGLALGQAVVAHHSLSR
jgi:hydrogenase maturation protein HypF